MRRLFFLLLISALAAPAATLTAQAVVLVPPEGLTGTRELGFFITGRVLSTAYSVDDARGALGGAFTFGTHLNPHVAIQGGLGVAYGSQNKTYYKPPLVTFTPTLSLLLQGSTTKDFQPYALVGAGYEFVRFTRPRCDCNQSRSLGIANLGVGVRKMIGDRRAFRIEGTSQIGSGGPAFSLAMGLALFVGGPSQVMKSMPRPPERVRTEPPVTPGPKTFPPPAPAPAPARVIPRVLPQPAPNLAGTILLTIDGTQVDFNKTAWRDDAEPLIDGVAVDLTSDAGETVRINIEGHTDNIGSRAAAATSP